MLEIKSPSEGVTLEKGKSSIDMILERGSTIYEASVARESVQLLLPLEICKISTFLNWYFSILISFK